MMDRRERDGSLSVSGESIMRFVREERMPLFGNHDQPTYRRFFPDGGILSVVEVYAPEQVGTAPPTAASLPSSSSMRSESLIPPCARLARHMILPLDLAIRSQDSPAL